MLSLKFERFNVSKIFCIIALTVSIFSANSGWANDDQYVFRGTKWGMSASDIIASESQRNDSTLLDDRGIMIYKMNIYDSEVTVMYHVGLDGLEQIYVKLGKPALGTQNLKDTFYALKSALDQKYGKMIWGEGPVLPDIWVTPYKVVMLVIGDPITIMYSKPHPLDPKPLHIHDFVKYFDSL